MNDKFPFVLPDLEYPYDSLEPYIDEKTVKIHHDKHFKKYVDNLNDLLKKNPSLQNFSLIEMLMFHNLINEDIRQDVINNAGGVYNHYLYFDLLSNDKDSIENYEIYNKILQEFGGFDKFYEELSEVALNTFGSGYAWLVIDKDNNFMIVSTKNQDTPLKDNLYPLLLIDVWEHAYYLKYQNKRDEYIDSFKNIINWKRVNDRYKKVNK